MPVWSAEVKELEKLLDSLRGRFPELEKDLMHLIKTEDENVVLLYARRCLEIIITDLCDCELKRPRGTEPLKGVIDKFSREKKIPSHIIASMQGLNELSTFGVHPKEFDPEQVRPLLLNLATIIKWYVKYKDTRTVSRVTSDESISEKKELTGTEKSVHKSKKRRFILISGIVLAMAVAISVLFIFNIIGNKNQSQEIEKSIAVLPFTSLSDDPEKQYLADGVMDAILLHLSKIEDLRVMSRTSVLQYRETEKTLNVIGKELGVKYLLEGSFQKYGDNARLIVQLIKTGKEGHGWANEYNRDWSDIFSVQSEVAQAIARELDAVITPEEKELINKVPTTNLTAYDLHLQALDFYKRYLTASNRDKKYLEKVAQLAYIALELDPEFALAYYWLGESSLSDRTISSEFRAFYEDTALFFFNKALELDPTLPEAYIARGYWFAEKNRDQEALEDMQRALRLSPNDSKGFSGLGYIYFKQTECVNALVNYKKAEKLEKAPGELAMIYARLYGIYLGIGDFQKAEIYVEKVRQQNINIPGMELWLFEIQGKWKELEAAARKYIELRPEAGDGYSYLSNALMGLGRISEAVENVEKFLEYTIGTDLNNAQRIGYILWMNGRKDEGMEYFDKQIRYCTESINHKDPYGLNTAAYDLAGVYAFLGNREEAYRWLREYEKLYLPDLLYTYIKVDPLFDSLRNDEEFREIIRRVDSRVEKIREKIRDVEEGR
ncbi:MAG: tetratricopeptide repeat protein [Calditrichaeota bacterium]|nr:MAG: tetratricopeptide repeat protein [Calditrichota bacterium]